MQRVMSTLRIHTARPGQLRTRLPGLIRPHLTQRSQLICRAASGRPEDRSWADLASEAADLAKGVVSKAATGLQQGIKKILPPSSDDGSKRAAPIERDSTGWGGDRGIQQRQDEFGGGIMGGLVGGLVGMAVKGIMGAVGEASQRSAAVRERAAAMIEADPRVRDVLGGGSIRVSQDPISQSSSTTIINGQRSAAVTLLLPIQSSTGASATAEVSFQQSPSQEDADADLRINVRTARGQIVYIDGSKTSAEGVIDVDWREVK